MCMLNKDEMREQYEEAISTLTETVYNYIGHEEMHYGASEQHQEIMEALELISKLVKKSVD